MKLFIYFSIIPISLLISVALGRLLNRTYSKILAAVLANSLVLGIGGLRWFFTETDGLSQGIGIMIYFWSFVILSLIEAVAFAIFSKKSQGGFK